MTGGGVLNVLFAALLGSFSLGLAAPIVANFSKGASAGARLFAVIQRTPAIDAGACPAAVVSLWRWHGISATRPRHLPTCAPPNARPQTRRAWSQPSAWARCSCAASRLRTRRAQT
jgi:hypothetical protein